MYVVYNVNSDSQGYISMHHLSNPIQSIHPSAQQLKQVDRRLRQHNNDLTLHPPRKLHARNIHGPPKHIAGPYAQREADQPPDHKPHAVPEVRLLARHGPYARHQAVSERVQDGTVHDVECKRDAPEVLGERVCEEALEFGRMVDARDDDYGAHGLQEAVRFRVCAWREGGEEAEPGGLERGAIGRRSDVEADYEDHEPEGAAGRGHAGRGRGRTRGLLVGFGVLGFRVEGRGEGF